MQEEPSPRGRSHQRGDEPQGQEASLRGGPVAPKHLRAEGGGDQEAGAGQQPSRVRPPGRGAPSRRAPGSPRTSGRRSNPRSGGRPGVRLPRRPPAVRRRAGRLRGAALPVSAPRPERRAAATARGRSTAAPWYLKSAATPVSHRQPPPPRAAPGGSAEVARHHRHRGDRGEQHEDLARSRRNVLGRTDGREDDEDPAGEGRGARRPAEPPAHAGPAGSRWRHRDDRDQVDDAEGASPEDAQHQGVGEHQERRLVVHCAHVRHLAAQHRVAQGGVGGLVPVPEGPQEHRRAGREGEGHESERDPRLKPSPCPRGGRGRAPSSGGASVPGRWSWRRGPTRPGRPPPSGSGGRRSRTRARG